MKIEFMVPFRHAPGPRSRSIEPTPAPQGNPPRIARLLALAHKLDALVQAGAIAGYGELARLGHASPARLTQIMLLLHLAPSIQEEVLFLTAGDGQFVAELALRRIAREPRWDYQRKLFDELLKR
jgi:hypothetical protein